jgi:hypothetical protein
VSLSLQEGANDTRLLEQAKALGMFPLAIRLHMEHTKQIEIPIEHLSFLVYRREYCRRRAIDDDDDFEDDTTTAHQEEDSPISHDISPLQLGQFEYYPGIELKLGKERDTIIRPAITSIFREYRETFKNALLESGLRYGDLRMWKDAQLCTAIHVADSFRPGIWNRAVELHIKKTFKINGSRRASRRNRQRQELLSDHNMALSPR